MTRRKLTEAEWGRVFDVRCRSKRGEALSDDDRALIGAAFASDKGRYAAMNGDVFDATVPAGSAARSRRG